MAGILDYLFSGGQSAGILSGGGPQVLQPQYQPSPWDTQPLPNGQMPQQPPMPTQPMPAQAMPTQPQMHQPSPFQNFMGALGSQATLGYLGGALQGGNVGQSIARGLQGYQTGMQADRTRQGEIALAQYLQQNPNLDPALKTALAANPALAGQYLATQFKPQTTDDIKEYEYAKKQGFAGGLTEFLQRKRSGAGEYGLNPIWGVDSQGRPAITQLGKGGEAVLSKMPEGFSPAKDPIKIDAGTHFVLLDPQTRQPIATVPKDVAGTAEAKTAGAKVGEAKFDLPRVEQNANEAISILNKIRNHPGLDTGVGAFGVVPAIPGTKQADFVSLVDQAKGGAFLAAFNTLKGGGAITEVEGAKATDAIARMRRTQTKAGFMEALNDYENVIRMGVERARKQAGQAGQAGSAATSAPAAAGGAKLPPPPAGFVVQ